ncbi:MAG: ABC transporter ATP-binding protein [bacterium]|nr:ABC transporter ATP-binding protein [bacterium]
MVEPSLAIKTIDLGRVYKIRGPKKQGDKKELIALSNVNLEVPRGQLFGLLGPNGAGKTTLIKILCTLLLPTSGVGLVDGLNVARQTQEVRRRISMVSGGETSGFGLLTIEENLWMFARLYGLDNKITRHRIGELLEILGIADRARTKISDLSTGLRQKMNFVRGFLTDPNVVFLDEPTLGLDVTAARDVRAFVKQWMSDHPDRTLLLTTHYMAEADELCDRLAIIDQGKLLKDDTPENLKRELQRSAIFNLKVQPIGGKPQNGARLENIPGVQTAAFADHAEFTEINLTLEQEDALPGVLAHLGERGSSLIALEKREPSLEDVFIGLVGRRLDQDTSKREDGADG